MNFTTTAMQVELYIYYLPVNHEGSHLRLIDVLYRISAGVSDDINCCILLRTVM